MKEFTVREDTTLKTFTDNYYAQASFCFRTLLKAREIRVNGARVSADMPLKQGDVVRYFLTPKQESRAAFSVVYEDGNVIVADKESGVNSEAVFSALGERGETYFIHRLDRNTAGLLIFAKNAEAEGELLSAFRDRRVEKIYLARVVGCPKEKHAVCTAYLKKDAAASRVRVSSKPVGEKINPQYEVPEGGGDLAPARDPAHGQNAPDPRAPRLSRISDRRRRKVRRRRVQPRAQRRPTETRRQAAHAALRGRARLSRRQDISFIARSIRGRI